MDKEISSPENPQEGAGIVYFFHTDNPGTICYNGDYKVTDSGSYQMFLMFQPSGGIRVPLKLAEWNWSGTGNADTNGVWTLGSTNAPPPSGGDTTIFPVWTNVVNWPTGYNIVTNNDCE